MDYTLSELDVWKHQPFTDELSFTAAADSLSTSTPLVVAIPGQRQHGSTWTLYDVKRNRPAVLFHAGIWAFGLPFEMGNYVLKGKNIPFGVLAAQVQSEVGFRCEISYGFDTVNDQSFYTKGDMFKDYIQNIPGFNRAGHPQCPWQNISGSPEQRRQFIMTSPLFSRKTPFNRNNVPNYPIHPRIAEALVREESDAWIASPRWPVALTYEDGELVALPESKRPGFEIGDIVWVSFYVSFIQGSQAWWPDYCPIELICVGRLGLTEDNDVRGDYHDIRKPLPTGKVHLPSSESGLIGDDLQALQSDGKQMHAEPPIASAIVGQSPSHSRSEIDFKINLEDHVMTQSLPSDNKDGVEQNDKFIDDFSGSDIGVGDELKTSPLSEHPHMEWEMTPLVSTRTPVKRPVTPPARRPKMKSTTGRSRR
ncbi:hypothetical protein JAAARDRAFT_188455 [Jaapia argillacea MUCL 33604]|uniref:Uncharacterized protein n=1 Tax=Jaapia argillacea MUCL 33604 TaxID=933084 RepID=A0A067QNR0_9AGAM|nr:hypothetical protein JAAARDRAFT_188455 [Jaapia argillacea MUCL 33604]